MEHVYACALGYKDVRVTVDVQSAKSLLSPFLLLLGDDESPTVVLARLDVPPNIPEPVTVAEGIVTPDPFRDVIRTEPAPNLQSLMGDMVPFLARQTSTTQKTTTEQTTPKPTDPPKESPEEEGSFFDMFKFLFGEEKTEENKTEITITTKPEVIDKISTTLTTTTTPKVSTNTASSTSSTTTTPSPNSIPKDPEPSKNAIDPIGILKLAGCNIYGRMYRVGRIISELSGPCRECRCTEIGVQCKNLGC